MKDDEPDPGKRIGLTKWQEAKFRREIAMFDRLKRKILRRRLEKEKARLLVEYVAVKKKIKILDELDKKDKK